MGHVRTWIEAEGIVWVGGVGSGERVQSRGESGIGREAEFLV